MTFSPQHYVSINIQKEEIYVLKYFQFCIQILRIIFIEALKTLRPELKILLKTSRVTPLRKYAFMKQQLFVFLLLSESRLHRVER